MRETSVVHLGQYLRMTNMVISKNSHANGHYDKRKIEFKNE